ncbi:MAG: acyl-[acyl-carrier-protein]--UDP-N-acetylglucosamine O-acyltransferase, partial [Gammaproteobacteria bacterium]
VGLKRRGFSDETIRNLRRAYNIIYRRNLAVKQAIEELESMLDECPEVQGFIDALQDAPRGVVR